MLTQPVPFFVEKGSDPFTIPLMPLDLLVPDLVAPPDAPAAMRGTRMRALERWLGRAEMQELPDASACAWLAKSFGLETLSTAAFARLGDGLPAEGVWMRADPVHLQIEGDALRLRGPWTLDVQDGEARALVAALNEHFAADGLSFEAAGADRWYARAPGEAPRTTPLEDAVGRDVFGLLPSNTSFNWRSALTEAQMILGNHEVNARRESERRPAINSIWLWGAGALPAAVPSRPYALVFAGDPAIRGLALRSGAQARTAVASIADVDLAASHDAVLVVLDSLSPALARGDAQAWQVEAMRLDEKWFARLGDAIERFDTVRVIFPSGDATRIATLTPSARWRWFRPSVRLAARA